MNKQQTFNYTYFITNGKHTIVKRFTFSAYTQLEADKLAEKTVKAATPAGHIFIENGRLLSAKASLRQIYKDPNIIGYTPVIVCVTSIDGEKHITVQQWTWLMVSVGVFIDKVTQTRAVFIDHL